MESSRDIVQDSVQMMDAECEACAELVDLMSASVRRVSLGTEKEEAGEQIGAMLDQLAEAIRSRKGSSLEERVRG